MLTPEETIVTAEPRQTGLRSLWESGLSRLTGAKSLDRAFADVSVMMVQQVASTGIGAVTSILAARGLGPEGLGLVGLTQNVTGMAMALSNLGLNQTAIRYASREMAAGHQNEALKILRWAFRQRMALVLAISFAVFLLAPYLARTVWRRPELILLIRVAIPISVLGALAAIPDVYFQSLRKFRVNAAVGIGQALVSLTGIVLLWAFGLWTPFLVITVSMLAAAGGALIFLAKVPSAALISGEDRAIYWPPNPGKLFQYPVNIEHSQTDLGVERPGRFAAYLLISSLLVMTTVRLDHWVLGAFRSAYDIGIYSIGMQLSLPLNILLGALNTTLFPRMASERTQSSLSALAKRAFKMSLLACMVGLVYAAAAPQVAPILLGERYRASVIVGHILCLRTCVSILACPLGVVGYGFGFARHYVFVNALQLVVVAGINYFFVGRYGPIVPALALLANDTIGMLSVAILIGLARTRQRKAEAL